MSKTRTKRIKSRSDIQTTAEVYLIEKLSETLGPKLHSSFLKLNGCKLQIDGFFKKKKKIILAESWAHIGKPKPAQKNKVLSDILKLGFVKEYFLGKSPGNVIQCYYVFGDNEASSILSGHSWSAGAARKLGVKSKVFNFENELRKKVIAKQRDQDLKDKRGKRKE